MLRLFFGVAFQAVFGKLQFDLGSCMGIYLIQTDIESYL